MMVTLREGLDQIWLVDRNHEWGAKRLLEVVGPHRQIEPRKELFLNREMATQLLLWQMRDDRQVRDDLTRLAVDLGWNNPLWYPAGQPNYWNKKIAEFSADAILAGLISAWHVPYVPPPIPPPPPVFKRPPPWEPTSTFFEMMVVWDHDGSGVSGIAFDVQAPDGQIRKLTTDGSGKIRLNDVKRGACRLSCELKGAELPTSVVPCGWGPSKREASGAAEKKDTVKHLLLAREYKVKDGDTLQSIADEAGGITWRDLVKFNWSTDDPKKVAEALNRDLGCWIASDHKGPIERYSFPGSIIPGILLVPRKFEERGLTTSTSHILRVRRVELRPVMAHS